MEVFHKKVLQKNHTQIVNDLDLGRSSVLDSLREDGLISSNEEEIILSERTKRNQTTKLLNYLKKRDPVSHPYDRFKQALESEYTFIVERLTNSEKELSDLAKDNHSKKCAHCILAKNLVPPDVTHSLYENGILTDDDLEELNNDNLPRQDRVKKLLELLNGKPDQRDTLNQFSRSLEVKYNYLVREDTKDGLKPYIRCTCKHINDNVEFKVKDNSKENIRASEDSLLNVESDKCASCEDNNNKQLNGYRQEAYISNGTVLQSLHDNGSSKSRSACESSWTGEFSMSDTEGNIYSNVSKKDNKITLPTSTTDETRREFNTEEFETHEDLNINDLSKEHDHLERSKQDVTKTTSYFNVKGDVADKDVGVQSGEDNTISTTYLGSMRVLCSQRSVCEDSWAESADEIIPIQTDLPVSKNIDNHGDEVFSHDSKVYPMQMHSVMNNGITGRNSCGFRAPFGTGTVSLEAMLGLASTLRMNDNKQDRVRLMAMPFNTRPNLDRLISSECVSTMPVFSGFNSMKHEEILGQQWSVKEKSKRRVKRKKIKSAHDSIHFTYDDVDGNPNEEHDQKEEDSPEASHSKQDIVEDVVDKVTETQEACAILRPVFRASPNNKKLMRRCSKLWDQLFLLRETGEWETFGIVTEKAFDKFKTCPDIEVLLYRSEMCVSTFYKNDRTKALEMFDKALEQLPKTEMPNWHLARILPLKVELCTRAKKFEEASNLLEDAKQAMLSLGPCLSTGAVYFFEAIYLGNILQCTRSDTKAAEGITEQVKKCFLTAIEHYQQEDTFAIKSFLNQVYLFLALFSLGVDFKKITYIQVRDIKREDISLAEHYLNLFENNCWGSSTNWSRMLFYIGRGEQHKQMNNLERSLDYFKQAQLCCTTGQFAEHISFIRTNIDVVSDKLQEQVRLLALRSAQSADDILKKVLESSSSDSGSTTDNV